ncbi:TPA: ferrous iron transport protein A, partial [Streptococcus suis]
MKLQNLQIGQSYIVQDCQLTDEIRKHLAHLGLNLGVEIRIISKTKANAIFQIRSSRIALDQGIIEALVLVEKPMNDETISLSDLAVGTTGIVTEIWAIGELRRRLMDMGITK